MCERERERKRERKRERVCCWPPVAPYSQVCYTGSVSSRDIFLKKYPYSRPAPPESYINIFKYTGP